MIYFKIIIFGKTYIYILKTILFFNEISFWFWLVAINMQVKVCFHNFIIEQHWDNILFVWYKLTSSDSPSSDITKVLLTITFRVNLLEYYRIPVTRDFCLMQIPQLNVNISNYYYTKLIFRSIKINYDSTCFKEEIPESIIIWMGVMNAFLWNRLLEYLRQSIRRLNSIHGWSW